LNPVGTAVFGAGKGPADYLWVLVLYGCMFLLIRHGYRRLELNFRKSFWTLYFAITPCVFIANYLLYLAGVMSFLPWLNNAFHCFLWIGLCLTYLYAGIRNRGFFEQFALCAILSFIVKLGEHWILGTWELNHFFLIPGWLAYVVGWSLMDGLLPLLNKITLRILGNVVEGVGTVESMGGARWVR